MNFDMKTPCSNCPFLPGSMTNRTLSDERMEEIISTLQNDGTFQCHKTIESHIDDQHCGGALVYMEKNRIDNNMLRIAMRLGLYDPNGLDMESKVIESEDY